MDFINVLKMIFALATIATGLFAFFKPRSIEEFTGLTASSGRGITEFRAIFGGLFIGIGLVPLVFDSPIAFMILGVTYLSIALARTIGIILDKSTVNSNWISLGIEVVMGVILIL